MKFRTFKDSSATGLKPQAGADTVHGVAAQRSSYVFASAVASANERATLDQIGFDHS
jgi:hypothetical protein